MSSEEVNPRSALGMFQQQDEHRAALNKALNESAEAHEASQSDEARRMFQQAKLNVERQEAEAKIKAIEAEIERLNGV